MNGLAEKLVCLSLRLPSSCVKEAIGEFYQNITDYCLWMLFCFSLIAFYLVAAVVESSLKFWNPCIRIYYL
ncbi:2-oxoglutarate and oxygenase superfamily protein [Salvia divinorum]|uniref:2-oxoglutarate and oxygenase superfamily protein n=1 Tax=Salvia divinorum TaxID=28513 RepID=A0ABD1H5E3_SALDI